MANEPALACDILIVSQHFHPDLAATGQILTELAEDLTAFGVNVLAYAGYPAYGESAGVFPKETYKGITIVRIPATRLKKGTRMGRILNTLSFFVAAFFYVLFSDRKRLLFFVTNPPYIALIGWIMKKLRGQRYVFLLHDYYPEVPVLLGYLRKDGITATMWRKMNRFVYRDADRLIVLGKYMKETLVREYGSHLEETIAVIDNWADGTFIKPIDKKDNWFAKQHGLTNKTVVLYSGNIGMFQQLEIMIEAAKRLKNEDILFLFIGDGDKKEQLQAMAYSEKLENVRFLPYQKKENLPYSLTCGDISLVSLEKGMEGLGVPSKLFGILASGRPAIALVSGQCEVADIIKESECGYVVDQDDLDGFTEKLLFLHKNPEQRSALGANSRKSFDARYRRDLLTGKYYELIWEICATQ